MQTIYRLPAIVFKLGAVLSLAACALSPQTVSIIPELDNVARYAPTGKRLAIQIGDKRADSTMGYRGGVYETAALITADDVTQTIYQSVSAAYNQAGFNIVADNAGADIRLNINIANLGYTAQQNNIIWNIEFYAVIDATARTGNREKSLQLEDRFTREYAKAPSTKENEKIINDVISKLLQRLVENREFLDI